MRFKEKSETYKLREVANIYGAQTVDRHLGKNNLYGAHSVKCQI